MLARLPLLLLLLATLGLVPAAAPARAASTVVDVQLTAGGPQPQQLTVPAGDSVRFVNADSLVHRVVSDSSDWAFDSQPLPPGASYTVQPALTRPGTYLYRGAGLDGFTGSVVVPGATPAPSASASAQPRRASPSASASADPSPDPSGSASPSATPSGSPSPAALVLPPPLAGDSVLAPASPGVGLSPQVAPGVSPSVPAGDVQALPAPAAPAQQPVAAAPVRRVGLASPVPARRYGLPLALALVLLGGVGSLLVRLLLAEAAAASRPVGPPA